MQIRSADPNGERKNSSRLTDSPAIVVGHESASMRRMMTMVESGRAPPLAPQILEINPTHPIITRLNDARGPKPDLAAKVANQVFSNSLVAAGLLDDPQSMLPSLNVLLAEVLAPYAGAKAEAAPAADSTGETKDEKYMR